MTEKLKRVLSLPLCSTIVFAVLACPIGSFGREDEFSVTSLMENLSGMVRLLQTKASALRAQMKTNVEARSLQASFMLYTIENTDLPEDASVSTKFSAEKETKVLIHGFMQSAAHPLFMQIKTSYLKYRDVNVILVDWPQARTYTYSIATTSTKSVGMDTARLLRDLSANLDKVHIIGFDLGAHVAGIAGSELLSQVGRITGLDPALPLFRRSSDYLKLDKNDAQFVDIIHTDAGDNFWFANHLGSGKPTATMDFYPNKGIFQPGCPTPSILNYDDMYCSHIRALELFAESIENPNNFVACKCTTGSDFMNSKCDCINEENLNRVGDAVDTKKDVGRYYFITRSRKPFGMGITGSRSPRENTAHQLTEILDELSVVGNEGTKELVEVKSLTDSFVMDEDENIRLLKSLLRSLDRYEKKYLKEENQVEVLDKNVIKNNDQDIVQYDDHDEENTAKPDEENAAKPDEENITDNDDNHENITDSRKESQDNVDGNKYEMKIEIIYERENGSSPDSSAGMDAINNIFNRTTILGKSEGVAHSEEDTGANDEDALHLKYIIGNTNSSLIDKFKIYRIL